MVVDFAVEDDPHAAIFIADGLMTGLHVDDAEAAHGKADMVVDIEAIVIGTAVRNLAVHGGERLAINALTPVRIKNAADSAHNYTPIRLGLLAGTSTSRSAHTRSSACSRTTCSASGEKISTFPPELTTSA